MCLYAVQYRTLTWKDKNLVSMAISPGEKCCRIKQSWLHLSLSRLCVEWQSTCSKDQFHQRSDPAAAAAGQAQDSQRSQCVYLR